VPRFYIRQLRAGSSAQANSSAANGAGAATLDRPVMFFTGFPAGVAPATPVIDPDDIAVAAVMTEDVAVVTGVLDADEDGAIDGAATTGPRRRRRRGRRGSGRSETSIAEEVGVLPDEPELEPETADFAREGYVPHVPPSSHLAELVNSGGLMLPEQSQRRRRRRGGRGRTAGETDIVPAEEADVDGVSPPAPLLPVTLARGIRERLSPLEEAAARQSVLLDQLLQRQTATLKVMERMMAVLERGGGRGGAGGSLTMLPRVAVFVDVPNIVYAAERINAQIDWGRVLGFVTRDRQLVRATAYAPVSDDPYHKMELQKFVHPFYNLPYRILTKPLKRFGNGEIKANFDVELAIDVVTMADRLDIVTLVSGDGDFRRMVELVQSKGVRVEVLAFGSSTAGELRAVCDDYIDFSQHLNELCVTR
jgi:uncharacterized LabA/DUF88 family protein